VDVRRVPRVVVDRRGEIGEARLPAPVRQRGGAEDERASDAQPRRAGQFGHLSRIDAEHGRDVRVLEAVVDDTTIGAGNAGFYNYVPLMAVALRSPGETATVNCRMNIAGGTAFADRATLSVVRLDNLTD
jgi:hypothetical protein